MVEGKTCLCHTETGVGTDPNDRHCPHYLNSPRPEDQSTCLGTKTLFKPAVQALYVKCPCYVYKYCCLVHFADGGVEM
ncbi:hypothetical protein I79_009284 [Cricetulus griseus]|uniref:Uncharacterized protein n=1 Tax=Cricetulus griseus TaxID=10029 RepID=G3HFC8_CRIGR|nr:hypothetical protein I79_009284 [Cricetulus griseus]